MIHLRHRPTERADVPRFRVRIALSVWGAVLALVGAPQSAIAAGEVVPPSVITHVDAVYPPSALAERKHGDVVLAVTVDVDGHVSKVDVLESGGADLDEAAIVAARQWTFVPAMRDGVPVRESHQGAVPFRAARAAARARRAHG